jgi:hypothetical protein
MLHPSINEKVINEHIRETRGGIEYCKKHIGYLIHDDINNFYNMMYDINNRLSKYFTSYIFKYKVLRYIEFRLRVKDNPLITKYIITIDGDEVYSEGILTDFSEEYDLK